MQQFRETQYMLLIDSFLFSSGVCYMHSALLPKYFPKAAFPTPTIPVRKQEEWLHKEALQRAPGQSRSPFCTARTEQTPSLSSTKATGFSYTKKTMTTILFRLCSIPPRLHFPIWPRGQEPVPGFGTAGLSGSVPAEWPSSQWLRPPIFPSLLLYIFRLPNWERCVKSLFRIISQYEKHRSFLDSAWGAPQKSTTCVFQEQEHTLVLENSSSQGSLLRIGIILSVSSHMEKSYRI